MCFLNNKKKRFEKNVLETVMFILHDFSELCIEILLKFGICLLWKNTRQIYSLLMENRLFAFTGILIFWRKALTLPVYSNY